MAHRFGRFQGTGTGDRVGTEPTSGEGQPGAGGDGPPERGATNQLDRLRRAISAAAGGTGSRAELEDAARALVHELRADKQPPEQMLLRIKDLLADAGLRPSYASPTELETRLGTEAAIYRDVISWSIKHYYEDGGGPPS